MLFHRRSLAHVGLLIALLTTLMMHPAAALALTLLSTSTTAMSNSPSLGMLGMALSAATDEVPLTIASAPINYDGDIAGKDTHLVLLLPDSSDPRVPGLAMEPGGTIRIVLPPDFVRNPSQPIDVALPRWPQANVCCYSANAEGNVITLTFKTAIRVDGPYAPGLKVLGHIRGAYTNPAPGEYQIRAEVRATPESAPLTAAGTVRILQAAPRARLAPTNFLLPRGGNANFQTILAGQEAPALLSLLLWRDGKPLDAVGVVPPDLANYPQYAGGLLVLDVDGDGTLDPATDEVIGGMMIAAPPGAQGQSVTNATDTGSKPILSGRLYGYGTNAPVPGLLAVRFRAGDQTGEYRLTFELSEGNAFQYTIQVVEP